ncbi:Ger(x)C family spore germination protein [Oceanobacillus halotolerans]|uniref:Ger(x)C family spore germination protein n=1 Tax=Oceanobacillus halotolerans TaxID=2663380 RepID=UPI0013DD3230|nr:Ger(x)C family spore germination protein [Oceanobacillus halotolerans]
MAKICISIYCALCILLVGCWDRIEIEERGFIIGASVDLAENHQNNNQELMLTSQFVVPSGLGAPTDGGNSSGAFMNLSVTGNSLFDMNRDMAKLTSLTPFYEHLKVIIISEEVVREPHVFGNVMDIFIRDHEMRRGVKVVISEGQAQQTFDMKPKNEDLPAIFIESVMENSTANANVLEPIHLGEVHEYLLGNRSFVLPRIFPLGNSVEYEGAAVFQGDTNKMVGILEGDEAKGLGYVTKENKGGVVKTTIDDQIVTLEIERSKSDITLKNKKRGNLKIDIKIDMEVGIAETFGSRRITSPKFIEKAEKAGSNQIKEIVNQTIKKVQEQYEADVLGIDNVLQNEHYDLWKEIREDWDKGENYFVQSTINVKADVKVIESGVSDKITNKNRRDY